MCLQARLQHALPAVRKPMLVLSKADVSFSANNNMPGTNLPLHCSTGGSCFSRTCHPVFPM